MTVENDPEHIPYFAFIPVGGRPDVRDRGQRKPIFRKSYLDSHVFIALKGKQMVDHCEIARWLAIAIYPHPLINGGEVVEHLVRPVDLFLKKAEQAAHPSFRYPES